MYWNTFLRFGDDKNIIVVRFKRIKTAGYQMFNELKL